MNKEQLAELRRLAEKATKGTWEAVEIGDFNCVCSTAKMAVISHDYKSMMSVDPDDDIKYIAASNPSFILQLLDYIESLEKSIKAKQALVDSLMLEFCPEEMTEDQIEEWRKHQKRVKGETETGGNTCEHCY